MEKVEKYLITLGLSYENVDETTWVVTDMEKGLSDVVIAADDPIVVIRVKVMDVPASKREELFETLLKLNAADILHGAYAIEGSSVILIDTLQYSTMDLEEFQASIDAIGLALTEHYQILKRFLE